MRSNNDCLVSLIQLSFFKPKSLLGLLLFLLLALGLLRSLLLFLVLAEIPCNQRFELLVLKGLLRLDNVGVIPRRRLRDQ